MAKRVPSKEDCLIGAAKSLENSERIFQAAREVARQSSSFGLATSLMVLAGEEAAKAAVFFGKAVDLPIKDEQLAQVFRKHRIKQEIATLRYVPEVLITLFIEMGKPEQERGKGQRWEKLDKKFGWWERADDLKQTGLYVGFQNGKWRSPSDITQGEFEEAHENVHGVLEIVRELVKAIEETA